MTIDFNHPLLGPAEPQPIQRTQLGIAVQTNGFCYPHPNRRRKGIKWLRANGFERFVERFIFVADGVEQMLQHIDAAWQARVDAWVKCGGRFAQAARLDPRKLTITIEAAPFHHPFYGPDATFSGMVMDGGQIHVVVAHVHSTGDFFQDYLSLAPYEVGNWLQLQLIGRPSNEKEEIGSRSPCG